MANLYAGTSGWAYAMWKPGFYPPKTPSGRFLSYYATRLNSVEVNFTFRSFPTQKLLKGWIEATPPGFRFAIKANQKITHVLRLRDASDLTAQFVACLEPLERAGKLGPLLFQLPPFLKCDVPLLVDFLAGLRPDLRAAFEFRHETWFTEDVFSALRTRNAALCFAESEKMETPQVQTADFAYLRLRREDYSPKSLAEQTRQIKKLCREGDVFAYFKHEDTPEGALRAETLLQTIGAANAASGQQD